jgi:hypothetical protein
VGDFDAETFGKGYGEENDFCLRVRKHGYINVAACKAYVAHLESQSFTSEEKQALIADHLAKLNAKYPSYEQEVADFIGRAVFADTAQLLMIFKEWRELAAQKANLLVVHSDIFVELGGVELCTLEMLKFLSGKKRQDLQLVLMYSRQQRETRLVVIAGDKIVKMITFAPEVHKEQIFMWVKQAFSVQQVIIEHLFNQSPLIPRLARQAKIPTTLLVHDFYYLCQIPDLIVDGKFAGFASLANEKFWDRVLAKKLAQPLPHRQWQELHRAYFIGDYYQKIIFSSEWAEKMYRQIMGIEKQKNWVVSYPDLEKAQ